MAHPYADRYGSDRMLLESVRGLVDAGADVVVTLPEPGPLVADLEAAGARVRTCPSPRLSKALLSPRGMLRLLSETVRGVRAGRSLIRRERPAVVYVSTVTVPLWVVLARMSRRPVVAHVHEAERGAPWLLRAALAAPLLLATRVLVNSRFALGVLAGSIPGVTRRAEVVLNGVVGPPRRTAAREVLDGPVRLAYLGRLSPRKGVDVAVSAVDELARRGVPATLDLVGAVFPGYEWYEAELRDQVALLGLDDRVRLLGFQDPPWPHVEAADVVLVPSRADEPFGNTAVEAVLSARPVVVSGAGGLLEATEGYGCALTVPPADPGALAEAVGRVVADWPRFRADAERDAVLAAERHAPERYRGRVAELVLGSASGTRSARSVR